MVDFKKIKTTPLKDRDSKVSVKDFYKLEDKIELLQNKDLEGLSKEIAKACKNKKEVVWMMGAHPIKCGLSPYIIDLMKKGAITHVALNGAGSIHDFEIAYIGKTSEDVEKNLLDGSFGMAEETGRIMNEALKKSRSSYGKCIGKEIEKLDLKFKEHSILYNAYKLGLPLTVHVAIGTDIIHQHPSCSGAAIGRSSYKDFQILTETISKLEGGVILNVGSAVILPEVFLKSLSIARNLGYHVDDFVAANLDMIDHYRPKKNVLERPGGKSFNILDKHQKTIPTLYHQIKGELSI